MTEPRHATLDVPYVGHAGEFHRMAYYEWGDAAAPPVLCVHGLTRNGRDFDFLAEHLSHDFHVIAPDMPGRGKSQWLKYPDEYALPFYMANMLFLMAALRLEAVRWVGTSMGGLLGMLMAATQPQRVRSLVLNDIGAQVSGAALARIRAYVGAKTEFPDRAAGEAALRKIYAPFNIASEAVWRHLFAHDLQELPGGAVRRAYDPAIGLAMNKDAAQPDMELWELWAQVQCPVLLVRGAVSDILSHEAAEKMQATHPGLELYEVANTGHAPTLAEAEQIERVGGWLKNNGLTT